MKWREQGTQNTDRYTVVPRTLVFVTHKNQVLLQEGAPNKRLWAGKLNGVGGHLEPTEDIIEGARREVREEAGLYLDTLCLRGIVHISSQGGAPGVMLFVFRGHPTKEEPTQSLAEGNTAWFPLDALPTARLVDDLPLLLSRATSNERELFYGLYETNAEGDMLFRFVP